MKIKVLCLLISLAGLFCLSAVAADKSKDTLQQLRAKGVPVGTITPVFSEHVVYSLPDGFGMPVENVRGNHYLQERVLAGETVEKWSQMITLSGAKGLAGNPNLSAQKFANLFALNFRKGCPETFVGKGLGALPLGGHDAFLAWVSCGTVQYGGGPPHSESALIIAIKGANDYYTLQWAETEPAVNRPVAFDEQKWKTRFRRMNPIRFCPVVPGEPPPYASCLNRK